MGNLPAYSTTAFLPRCLWERTPGAPTARTPPRLGVPLPAPAGQRAGEVRGASPGCSGGVGLGMAGGGRQGRADGTWACTGSARTVPLGRRHEAWT